MVVALNRAGQYAATAAFLLASVIGRLYCWFFDVVGSLLSLAEPARHPVIK